MSQGGTPPVPESQPSGGTSLWSTMMARAINLILRGKINCLGAQNLTLTAGATTTTLTDERIGATSYLGFMPITAAAATAKQGLYVSARNQGSAVLTHASAGATTQTFVVAILG